MNEAPPRYCNLDRYWYFAFELSLKPSGIPNGPESSAFNQFEIGKKIGKWKVVGPTRDKLCVTKTGRKEIRPKTPCVCECNPDTIHWPRAYLLRNEGSMSCGCGNTERGRNKSDAAWTIKN